MSHGNERDFDSCLPKNAKTKVYITVDTEASIAGCFSNPTKNRPQLERPVFGYVNNQSQGLGFILETLKQYQQVATFFTESLQSRYFGQEPMSRVAQLIKSYHQDLQLHVHPCWTNFEAGRLISSKLNDHSTGRSVNELVDIFADAIARFNDFGFGDPVAVRTGNFSTGLDTFKAFSQLGIKASSNIATELHRPIEPQLQLTNGIHLIEQIIELPLTTFNSYSPIGVPRRRSMAITACSFNEIKRILLQAHQQQLQHVCILTHPFEFFKTKGTTIATNRLNQQRLMQLCQFIQCNQDKFETATFSQLAQQKSHQTAINQSSLNGSYPLAIARASQNFLYDTLS